MSSRYEKIMRAINPKFLPTKQQRAVIESRAPAILVVAGAGSGKTATMANKIAYHVAEGHVRPEEVLGLTFTRKAAGELAQRVESSLARVRSAGLIHQSAAGNESAEEHALRTMREGMSRPSISTYNSFASEIASSRGMLIGLDPASRLITDGERWQMMDEAVGLVRENIDHLAEMSRSSVIDVSLSLAANLVDNDVTPDRAEEFFRAQALHFQQLGGKITGRKVEIDPKEAREQWNKIAESTFATQLACLEAVRIYNTLKRERGLIEFSDQVASARKVLLAHPEIGRELSDQYRLVLLDEYQDTSVGQAEFIRLALGGEGEGRSVCAVGDPNQSIYGWRGASANALADFGRDFSYGGAIERLTLSTSFRSDKAILGAANAVSLSLTNEAVEVEELQARKDAGEGRVVEVRTALREDSYRSIALRIRDVMHEVEKDPKRDEAEIAVLCRARSYMSEMAGALEELNIPYEIIGGESLIMRPEILTIRALIGVVARPNRNDLVIRLMNHWGVGSDDLRVLSDLAKKMACRQIGSIFADQANAGAEIPSEPRMQGEPSLVEAVSLFADSVALERSYGTFAERLSTEGRRRLSQVASCLETIRSIAHEPISDVVSRSVRLLHLDLVAGVRSTGSQRVRTSLDSFITLGRGFHTSHPGTGLSAFVDWLDAVQAHEQGGEENAGEDEIPLEDVEVHPGVVQILTVHAAKGLEWRDLVAIPEMVEGQVSDKQKRPQTWLTKSAVFPFPLRQDYAHLPQFCPTDFAEKIEAAQAYYFFSSERLLEHENDERRRLAYVAFTRPTRELLLAGYVLKDAPADLSAFDSAKPPKVHGRSVYLEEVLRAAGRGQAAVVPIAEIAGADWPSRLTTVWENEPTPQNLKDFLARNLEELPGARHPQQPIEGSRGVASAPEEAMPHKELDGVGSAEGAESAASAQSALGEEGIVWPSGISRSVPVAFPVGSIEQWRENAEVLIREKRERGNTSDQRLPYLTATDLVGIASDPETYRRNMLRRVPQRPSGAARTGTKIHLWIAHHFQRPAAFDLDSITVGDYVFSGEIELETAQEKAMGEAFLATEWARMNPVAVEEKMSIVIGGEPIRCAIDAVFENTAFGNSALENIFFETGTEAGSPRFTIVDWKTGRHPSSEQIESRKVQLGVYCLAWSRAKNIPLENIEACFVYLGEKDPERRVLKVAPLTEGEIAEKIELVLGSHQE